MEDHALAQDRGESLQAPTTNLSSNDPWRDPESPQPPEKEHSVILTAQRDSFYNRGKLNYHPIGKDSRWAVQRLSRYPRCAQAPSGRGCAMNSTLALTSGSIGWRSSCP